MKFEGRLEGRELTRRAARIDVTYDALVRFGCTAIEAMILNVSSKGFRLHAAEELEEGMEVTLEVEKREPVRGLIRWTCGQESGGVFLEAIAL
ncbi:MAG: PilZ domain-containing protein [Sphingomicrobium sp.]